MTLEATAEHRVAGGTLRYCRHDSAATGAPTRFSLSTPPGEGGCPPHPAGAWWTCTGKLAGVGMWRAVLIIGFLAWAGDATAQASGRSYYERLAGSSGPPERAGFTHATPFDCGPGGPGDMAPYVCSMYINDAERGGRRSEFNIALHDDPDFFTRFTGQMRSGLSGFAGSVMVNEPNLTFADKATNTRKKLRAMCLQGFSGGGNSMAFCAVEANPHALVMTAVPPLNAATSGQAVLAEKQDLQRAADLAILGLVLLSNVD